MKQFIKKNFPGVVRAYRAVKRHDSAVPDPSLALQTREEIFHDIYVRNYWGDAESRSGPGSNLANTEIMRRGLEELVRDYKIMSILDIPCGDFNWMKNVDLGDTHYIGADIVSEIVSRNSERYSSAKREFKQLDMVKDLLPKVDLVICRDVFIHFAFQDIFDAVQNIKRSGSKYLLTTTYDNIKKNTDIRTSGSSRALNFKLPPFSLKDPIRIIQEDVKDMGRNLSLWNVSDL